MLILNKCSFDKYTRDIATLSVTVTGCPGVSLEAPQWTKFRAKLAANSEHSWNICINNNQSCECAEEPVMGFKSPMAYVFFITWYYQATNNFYHEKQKKHLSILPEYDELIIPEEYEIGRCRPPHWPRWRLDIFMKGVSTEIFDCNVMHSPLIYSNRMVRTSKNHIIFWNMIISRISSNFITLLSQIQENSRVLFW